MCPCNMYSMSLQVCGFSINFLHSFILHPSSCLIFLLFFMFLLLRCQAQLELTLMMCFSDCSTSTGALSDRSTFTSTDTRAMDLHHYFFGGLVVVQGHVCLQELKLSPPLSFHGIRAWYRLRAEQQAQEAKEAIRQQEVIIFSPFVFATTPVSELFGRHRQTTSD